MAQPEQVKTRPIIGEGDETTGQWVLRYCTQISLTTLELAILCACWYARQKIITDASRFIPPDLFQFQEDLLIPGARRRQRVEIKDPVPILSGPIQILLKEDFNADPTQHAHITAQEEKEYLRDCCCKGAELGLPQLYRIGEPNRFQLFSSLIWAIYAGRIESSEIQEEETQVIPQEVRNAQEIFRQNFILPHQRFMSSHQINNEARRVLTTIKEEAANLLPPKEKEKWLAKNEQQISDDIFRTRQAVLKGYMTKEEADQKSEQEEAAARVEAAARMKKLGDDNLFAADEAEEAED